MVDLQIRSHSAEFALGAGERKRAVRIRDAAAHFVRGRERVVVCRRMIVRRGETRLVALLTVKLY